ncbi:PAS domain-containing protein [Rhodocytophaga aerolata]|uniref:histidine kinase n=1 Tax=Rhodocytophaga aerolata TaxID=455078 RepID=A0ABT8R425_9BACT|nr:PAS domain-containing protein [Rhodocytophaga aerolata]MDO1446852.1 PAS domain-containing protein [Rhodocytophaga aerolata]
MLNTNVMYNLPSFASYVASIHLADISTNFTKVLKEKQLYLSETDKLLPEDIFNKRCLINLQKLLKGLATPKPSKALEEYFYLWYPHLPDNCCNYLLITDTILSFFHIHQQLLLQYLPYYTSDVSQAVNIAGDIGKLFANVERKVLHTHLQQQQDVLVKSQHLLSEAQEIAQVGSWEWDLASDQILFSEQMLHIFGLKPDQSILTPQLYLQLLHPGDVQKAFEIFHECINTGQSFAFEHRIIDAEKQSRWVLCKGKIIRNTKGHVERLVGASVDISEQKQAQKQLLETNQELAHTAQLLRDLNNKLEQRVAERSAELLVAIEKIRQLLKREQIAHLETDLHRKQVENLFMQAPVALGIFNGPHHIIVLANQALCNIWGRSQDEVVGKPLFEALPELKGQVYENLLETVFTSGELYVGNEVPGSITRNGKRVDGFLNFVYQPVKNAEGEITSIITVANEVTEQVIYRKKTEESESRVLRILDSMPEIAWTANTDGKNTFLNKKWFEFTGYYSTKLFHELSPIIVHEADTDRAKKLWEHSVATGEAFQAEYRLKRRDGEYRWVLVRALALRNEAGAITEWVGTATDIHEQKQIQDFLYTVLEAIPHLAWTSLPNESSVNYYNKRWYQYTALTPEESIGGGWKNIVHPDDFALTVERITAGRKAGQPWEVENRYRRAADGMYRWHLSRAVPIKDASGNISLWVGTATDIHDQKNTQYALEHTLDELNEKNFELDQFVYKTSHDLRAPLSTILGLVTILKQEKEECVKNQYIDLIESRVNKLDKFIKSMLDYSRNTRTGVSCEQVDLEALAKECVHELEYMKHFSRVQIILDIRQKQLYTDLFRLKIIFSNLISNAIKYQDFAKEQSRLTIEISTSAQSCIIRFTDNGIGIEQAYQDRIFNMFFRASENSEGSGLGLYIIKQGLAALNGTISFSSEIGVGTEFVITLPLVNPV